MVVFEGVDAAGKGTLIRRLVEKLDPRLFRVIPAMPPSEDESRRHFLRRFWRAVPPLGSIAVLDRTHYGRVLVERVEGFCSKDEWKRAFREINEWESQLVGSGCAVVKFWLHISKEEQLRRFQDRERDPYRRYKLTEEDWRNRAKWDLYRDAVEDMLARTSTTYAPWTVVEADDKWWARVKIVQTLADRLEESLRGVRGGRGKGKGKGRGKRNGS